MSSPALPTLSALCLGLLAAALLPVAPARAQTAAPPAPAEAQARPPGLAGLAWFSGCWHAEGAEAGSGEQWLPLAGNTLMGVSRTVRRGTTVAFEFMHIRQQPDGSIVFAAQPGGRPETLFTLLPGPAQEAVFENTAIEFPQRVIYRLEDGGRLRARIEGRRNGQPAGIDFPLRRASCDL